VAPHALFAWQFRWCAHHLRLLLPRRLVLPPQLRAASRFAPFSPTRSAPTLQHARCASRGHIALAKETDQAPYCPDCWGESLAWASGAELADLKQWEAFIQERRLHHNGGYGDEPTVCCDWCNTLLEAADTSYNRYNGKPICGRCKGIENEVIFRE
jgi:hypothetical protein